MRILFLHPHFPAQFRHIAAALAKDKRNQVVSGTTRKEGIIPGVAKVIYSVFQTAHPETHHYLRNLETAVVHGQIVYRLGLKLKKQGFVPDIVYGHSGWGPTLFMKDIFPKAKLLCYYEWFYRAHGSNADFDPTYPINKDEEANIRIRNVPILIDLYSCDGGLAPTSWQQQQFPVEFRRKIIVRHDGVDTDYFKPKPGAKLVLPAINLDLSEVKEVVTYATQGMEPYRGFPQFMEAAALIQQQRPNCHIVVVGKDRVVYGNQLPEGQSYKQLMLEKLSFDLSRLHFTGLLPYNQYLQVLQASSVHVYLTYPFILSWSMLEAMATGCLIVASHTPPVLEFIKDEFNGLLVDFFSPEEIAARVNEALDKPEAMMEIRAKARKKILKKYALADLLPKHIQWLKEEARR